MPIFRAEVAQHSRVALAAGSLFHGERRQHDRGLFPFAQEQPASFYSVVKVIYKLLSPNGFYRHESVLMSPATQFQVPGGLMEPSRLPACLFQGTEMQTSSKRKFLGRIRPIHG